MRQLSSFRFHARGAVLAMGLVAALASVPVSAETLVVVTDRAKIIKLPEKTATVIVGNPTIADVTIGKNGLVVLTGKSFGVTNLISLDTNGAILNESTVQVQLGSENMLVMQRGMDRQTYSCTPNCLPTVALGDDPKFLTDTGNSAQTRNGFATSK